MPTRTDDSLLIDCPLHPGLHWAVLDVWPAKYAGIYECPRGYSEACEHPEWKVEDAVRDYYDPGDPYGHGQHEFEVYVCALCGVQIEDEDPAVDRHEAMVDAQIDEMRGK